MRCYMSNKPSKVVEIKNGDKFAEDRIEKPTDTPIKKIKLDDEMTPEEIMKLLQ